MQQIQNDRELFAALELRNWSVYARVPGRHDVYIFSDTQVRFGEQLMVNAGEQHYNNQEMRIEIIPGCEEWVNADLLYLKHQCEGCTYPPDMCCGGGSDYEYERGSKLGVPIVS